MYSPSFTRFVNVTYCTLYIISPFSDIYSIAVDRIYNVLLHIRDIYHTEFCDFFELAIVNVGSVDGKDVSRRVIVWLEHETVPTSHHANAPSWANLRG